MAQVKLSDSKNGDFFSINWGWGIGVMMGVLVAGGVSGKLANDIILGNRWRFNVGLKGLTWTQQFLWLWLLWVNSHSKRCYSTGLPSILELSQLLLQSWEYIVVSSLCDQFYFGISQHYYILTFLLSPRCNPILRTNEFKWNFAHGWYHEWSWTCWDLCNIPCCLVIHPRRNGRSGNWIDIT